jgi:hypothetical protein
MIDLYTELATVNLWSLVYKKDLYTELRVRYIEV